MREGDVPLVGSYPTLVANVMSDNTQKSKIRIMEWQLQRALNLYSPINAITAHAPTKSSSSHTPSRASRGSFWGSRTWQHRLPINIEGRKSYVSKTNSNTMVG